MEATPVPDRTQAARARPRLSPATRRALLVAHIVASVGLLGEVSGFLAVAIRAAASADPAFAATSYDLLATFSAVFGIPLSFTALLTGIALGLGGKWGVLRTPWVAIKLGLLVTVILVGALVLGPSVEQMRTGAGDAETRIVIAAAWDVAALLVATGLSVYKPGRTRRRRGAQPSHTDGYAPIEPYEPSRARRSTSASVGSSNANDPGARSPAHS